MFKSSKQGPRGQCLNVRRAHFPHATVSLNYKTHSELRRAKDGWPQKGRSLRVGIPGGFITCSKVRGKDRREQRLNVRRAHFPHAAVSPNYKTYSELGRVTDGWPQKGRSLRVGIPGGFIRGGKGDAFRRWLHYNDCLWKKCVKVLYL